MADNSYRNSVIKNVGLTLLFYGAYALLVFVTDKNSPSGPCTPGIGIMLLLLLPFVSGILCLKKFIKARAGDTSNHVSAVIHLVVVAVFIILFKIN
jgi:uncharacterized membrane-anchored protein